MEAADTVEPANRPPRCPRCGAAARPWVRAHDRTGRDGGVIARCTRCGIGITVTPGDGAPAAPTRLPAVGPLRAFADLVIRRELVPLTSVIAPGAAVLDVGAGGGDRALVLARDGYRVTAVEPDPHEAARARAQLDGKTELHVGTLEELPAGASGYDAALLSHVLEHLPEPDESLRLVRERLRPGGAVAIMVPNAGGLQARLFRGRWHQWEPARHRWHFAAPVLAEMLRGAGYRDVRVRASGGWRYPSSLAYSIAPWLDPQVPGSPPAIVGRLFALLLVPVAALEVGTRRGPQLVATARRP
jgi:2-polyprenyl-3-methyl-5-hydroxy-6-metoxy-1,4-benzoquinol methylase